MKLHEKEISSLAIKHLKELTGKGPKNIYTKVDAEKIEFHFWLQKSPLEMYACEEINEGKYLVKEIYMNTLEHCVIKIEKDIAGFLNQEIEFHCLDVDIGIEKFKITFHFK
jgi:uncharacterized protein YbcI